MPSIPPLSIFRAARLGAALALLAVTCAHGAGLGDARGAVLLGRPLDVRLPVLQDQGEALATDCVQASVAYGDSPVPARLVTASVESAAGTQSVRVRATPAINEPVVSLQVQVGCRAMLTRRVVLLADPVLGEDTAPQRVAPPVGAVPQAAPAAPRRQAAAAAPPTTAAGTTPVPKPRAVAERPRRAGAASPPVRNRLQVEPLDLTPPSDPSLRLSDTLAPREEASTEARARWAAAWRALNAQADDFAQLQQRIGQLQREQQASAARQRDQQAGFEKRLAQLEAQRYANPLVLALAIATLAALALAAALAWRLRRRTQERWWEGADDDDTEPARPTTMPAAAHEAEPEPEPGAPLVAAAVPAPAAAPRAEPRRHDFDFSPRSAIMSLEAEELLQVKESVDFFAALGQYDRAVDALRQHVERHPETSALGWLELLHLLVALGRRDDFTRARAEMVRLFNIDVPSFDRWDSNQRRLEQYPGVMERITAMWPSADVLQVIEHAIFREEDVAHQETFSVAAFDDLVLLHEVCREVVEAQASGAGGLAFEVDWRPSAWNKLQGHRAAAPTYVHDVASDIALDDAGAELDLDLSQHGDLAAEPAQAHAPDGLDIDLALDVDPFDAPGDSRFGRDPR